MEITSCSPGKATKIYRIGRVSHRYSVSASSGHFLRQALLSQVGRVVIFDE